MFEFALAWTNSHSHVERAIDANAVIENVDIREVLILPLLLIALLFALGITGAHLHERTDPTSSFPASDGTAIPRLCPSSGSCRMSTPLGSVPRLRHADVPALLTTG